MIFSACFGHFLIILGLLPDFLVYLNFIFTGIYTLGRAIVQIFFDAAIITQITSFTHLPALSLRPGSARKNGQRSRRRRSER